MDWSGVTEFNGCIGTRPASTLLLPSEVIIGNPHDAAENIAQADALLFGRVTYAMMEEAWRGPAQTGVRPDWMEAWMLPFAQRKVPVSRKSFSRAFRPLELPVALTRDLQQRALPGHLKRRITASARSTTTGSSKRYARRCGKYTSPYSRTLARE